MARHVVATEQKQQTTGRKSERCPARLARDEKPCALRDPAEQLGKTLRSEVMQKKIGRHEIDLLVGGVRQPIKHIGDRNVNVPAQPAKTVYRYGLYQMLSIDECQPHTLPAPCPVSRESQHKGAVTRAELHDAARWRQKFQQL